MPHRISNNEYRIMDPYSTANSLRELGYTPEQIKGFLGHRTGTAFRRYFYSDKNEKIDMVKSLSGETNFNHI